MQLKKKSKGFTLIELMVVIVIIGILVAIALPNFISAQDRAKISSVKANAHTIQTMLETYAVDWQGTYPTNIAGLQTEASTNASNKYWKQLKNPFSGVTTTALDDGSVAKCGNGTTTTAASAVEGTTYYNLSGTTKYYIYGGDKGGGKVIADTGNKVFILTNS